MSVDVFSAHNNPEQARLDPARTAVIVVDMINEFCKPGGRMVLQCRGHEITEGMHPQYDLFKQWTAVKRPLTVVIIRWRTANSTLLCVGSIDQVVRAGAGLSTALIGTPCIR